MKLRPSCRIKPGNRLLGEEEALSKLQKLAKSKPRDVQIQMQYAEALTTRDLQEASRIARRLIAGAPPGSTSRLAAHWLYIRNLVQQGATNEAQKEARRLLAQQPIDSALWKGRFEQIAKLP